MTTASGEQTAALYGFSSLLLKLLREEKPSSVAFARDLPQPTFRHERYAEYKAGRPPVPDAMRTQWAHLDALIEALDVPSHAAPGFEADDVLASLTYQLNKRAENVLIVSGDRDQLQMIGPHAQLLFVGARQQKPEKIDPKKVEQRYGISPSQMPMWSALVGEIADNLRGVDGIGAKTASKLVAKYGSAKNLIANLESVTPPKIREALREASERVATNEELATLRSDLDLPEPLTKPITSVALAHARAIFEKLEFRSLIARLDKLEQSATKPAARQMKLF